MSKSLNTLFTALLLAGAGNALAASSVDLTVKGFITPSACEPTLSAGGVVELGKVSAKDLNADQPTDLPAQYLELAVICDASTLMALEGKDNRAGSDFADDPTTFGLGFSGTEKVGSMQLRIIDPIADGSAVWAIASQDGGSTWIREYYFARDNILSVANTGVAAPIAVEQFSSRLKIAPTIAPANDLTLTNEVAIDGSVTLTVKYL